MRNTGGLAAFAFALLALAACETQPATMTDQRSPLSGDDDLYAVEGSGLALAAARPDVDWASYDKIVVDDLVIPDQALDAKPMDQSELEARTDPTNLGASWTIPREDADTLAEAFREEVVDEFQRGGEIDVVDEPGPGVLVLQTEVVEIELAAPIDESRDPFEEVYTQESGSMTIAGAIVDGQSGEVLARFEDKEYPTEMWQQNNRVTNVADAREVFSEWARTLHRDLVDAQSGSLGGAAG